MNSGELNPAELHSYADKFLHENFGLKLEIPIRISKRMKSKLGAFQIKLQNRKVVSKGIGLCGNTKESYGVGFVLWYWNDWINSKSIC